MRVTSRYLSALAAWACIGLTISCDDGTGPKVGPPASITKQAGDNQTATVGTAVATAPSVLVKDQGGTPVPNVTVTFAVASGGGSVTGGTATTNAQGIATVGSWTLGATAGAQTLTASVSGVSTPATFTATATAGAAASVTKQAGDNQTATAGTAVPVEPSVLVKDANNNPVSGVTVTFAVASGGGGITGGSATTNASGIATVGSWTLGTTAGANTLTATAGSIAAVTFTATGTAGQATGISKHEGDNQSAMVGTAVTIPPAVLLKDANNNPVPNAQVTFTVRSGGGSITGGSATTNAQGIARVGSWTLGSNQGTNTLEAAIGATTIKVEFTATATPPAANVAKQAGDNQSATVATAVATKPSVLVTDANNNPVPGVTVTFAVASGGGSITGATQTTNASGIATVGSWTLGTTAGTNTLTATVSQLSPVTFTATGTPGAAASVTKEAGDNQTATAGSTVATAPQVKVLDQHGNAVPNVSLTFSVAFGGGSITGANQTTDASGFATVGSWRLGTTAGSNTLTATVSGVSPAVFTATGVAGAPASITKHAGDAQSAVAGTTVPTAPAVLVKDANNNPVPDTTVVFSVSSADHGQVTGASARTNSNGVATVGSWKLGSTPGTDSLYATVNGLTAAFSATALDPCTVAPTHTIGATVNGALETTDCLRAGTSQYVDFYTTTTSGTQSILFTQNSTAFDTHIQLADSTGMIVAEENMWSGITGEQARIRVIMAGARYKIGASADNGGAANKTGPYSMASATASLDVTNCAKVFVTAGISGVAQSVQTSDCLFSSTFYGDKFIIKTEVGRSYTISMNSTEFDALLRLKRVAADGTETLVASNDDIGSGDKNARIIYTATATEYLVIEAATHFPNSYGAYTLGVQ